MLIRKARKQDVDAIVLIERQSFQDNAFSRRAVSYHIENNLVLCCEIDSRVAGYICFSPLTKTKSRRIYSIAVDSLFRKRGVGQALMLEGEKKSKSHTIVLEVDETNTSAIALYQKLGYNQFGRYIGYYGKTDAIRMKKVTK